MKIKLKEVDPEPESRLVRLRYEPSQDKYILAYSDEEKTRVASREEIGDLAVQAVRPTRAPEGALATPLVVQIAITAACNLECKFCYAELAAANKGKMSTAEIEGIIDSLHENGVVYLEWAGGEPLLRKDFVPLLRYADERDFKQSVLTNGTAFNEDFIEFASTRMRRVQISVDNIREEYDAEKGGSYWDAFERNVHWAIEAGVPAIASVCITERNGPFLEEIVEWIHSAGFREARLSWQIPMGDAKETALADYNRVVNTYTKTMLRLSKEYIRKGLTISAVHDLAADESEFLPREYLLCSAGRSRLYIDWNGDAYSCPVLKYPELKSGNILESGLEGVWFNEKFDELRSVKNGKTCSECKLYCGYWCRALVYGFTRDISMNPGPNCPHARTEMVRAAGSGEIAQHVKASRASNAAPC
ncbi:MAG: radical SAM protein [Myxococcota bacterium]|nr:radical SAM protein [Myxococcota bacterium]